MEKNIDKILECQKAVVKMKKTLEFAGNWIAAVKYLCARKGLISLYTTRGIPESDQSEIRKMEEYLRENEKYFINE